MDRRIFVSDITMKLSDGVFGNVLSFRQKLELSKLLDKLGISVIETCGLTDGKKDVLLVKSLASAISESTLAIPVDIFDDDSIAETWNALKDARHPRLQVSVPVSTVQMEYICHLKPAAVMDMVGNRVRECRTVCDDVEFIAVDFTRSDRDFLYDIVDTAIRNGATVVTMHDSAGTLFGFEFSEVIKSVRAHIPENVRLGVRCSNEMFLSDSCAVAAVCAGADEVKTVPHGKITTSLKRFVKILETKSELCHAHCDVNTLEILRTIGQIKSVCLTGHERRDAAPDSTHDGNALRLTRHDSKEAVVAVANKLGYYLDEDDSDKVYDAFLRLASENGAVEAKELDAIIASVAFQAPAKYNLESYLINSGNTITATCHMRLRKDDAVVEGVCLGDGPVDAAFRTIEQLVGKEYELDDFQIQSVTEGREAMGRAVVRLCHNGSVFSGCGISRDIVGASIMAYLSAVNKIEFEENNA